MKNKGNTPINPYLAIEGFSGADICVNQFRIHKAFQEMFACHIRLTWFDRNRSDPDKLLKKAFSLHWPDNQTQKLLFSGIIQQITIFHNDDQTEVELTGFTPLHNRLNRQKKYRAYQKENQVVLDILEQIGDFRFKIFGDSFQERLSLSYPLGIQSDETDFGYARHLLSLFGIPILLDEEDNEFIIGYQNKPDDEPILYEPEKDPCFRTKSRVHSVFSENQLCPDGRGYTNWEQHDRSDVFQSLVPGIETVLRQSASAGLVFTTRNRFFYPGDLLHVTSDHSAVRKKKQRNTSELLRVTAVQYDYVFSRQDLNVTVSCVPSMDGKYSPIVETTRPTARYLGKVVKTNGDPQKMGRIQVGLFTSQKHYSKSIVNCWLPVITPYAGAYEGFCFLPEKGNQVIVECLDILQGQWAVTGTLRTQSDQNVNTSKPEQVKVLRTSKNNQIYFRCKPSASMPIREIIRIENGINSLEFDSKSLKSGKITLMQNKKPVVTISRRGGTQTVEIESEGDLILKAGGNIEIEAKKNLIMTAKTGDTRINSDDLLELKSNNIEMKSDNKTLITAKKGKIRVRKNLYVRADELEMVADDDGKIRANQLKINADNDAKIIAKDKLRLEGDEIYLN